MWYSSRVERFVDTAALASDLRATLSSLKRRLRERGSVGDLTPSQTDVLRRLDRDGPATASGLARASGMRPQSMSAIVASLEAEGLVAGAPDPDDRRQTVISLTALCRDRLAKGRAAHQDWLIRRIDRLTAGERAQLIAATAILRRMSEE